LRSAIWLTVLLWALGWFGLYLEIYRYHHVTPSLSLNPPASVPGTSIHAHPGGFLITVLVTSALAPPAFAAFCLLNHLLAGRTAGPPSTRSQSTSPLALVVTAIGATVCLSGTINHFLHEWRERIDFDLTMRHGDGGFMVNGAALAALGLTLSRHRFQRFERGKSVVR
jgi:hypothetical protein